MTIIYKKNEKNIRIFGLEFVKNNKDKCLLIIKDKLVKLEEFYENDNEKYGEKITIILKQKIFLKNMSYIFSHCKSLSSLPNISKLNTNNVNNMSGMFSYCKSLSSLPNKLKKIFKIYI